MNKSTSLQQTISGINSRTKFNLDSSSAYRPKSYEDHEYLIRNNLAYFMEKPSDDKAILLLQHVLDFLQDVKLRKLKPDPRYYVNPHPAVPT